MDAEEIAKYVRHGKLCIDLRFDQETGVVRAIEITRQKTTFEVSLRYLPYEPLSYISSEPIWNLDGAETLARIRGKYDSLESIVTNLESYLGTRTTDWQNYSRTGYHITLSDIQLSNYKTIAWEKWSPTENRIVVPKGTLFTIIMPNAWIGKVRLDS